MPHPARSMLLAAVAAAALACSGGDSTGPGRPPSRAELNGVYGCYKVDAYYYNAGTKTSRWREGRCSDYIAITNPSREYERDTVLFQVRADNEILRLDWLNGSFSYDSTTGIAEATYGDGTVEVYKASVKQLVRLYEPFDFTGDGLSDSLRITFVKVQ